MISENTIHLNLISSKQNFSEAGDVCWPSIRIQLLSRKCSWLKGLHHYDSNDACTSLRIESVSDP